MLLVCLILYLPRVLDVHRSCMGCVFVGSDERRRSHVCLPGFMQYFSALFRASPEHVEEWLSSDVQEQYMEVVTGLRTFAFSCILPRSAETAG